MLLVQKLFRTGHALPRATPPRLPPTRHRFGTTPGFSAFAAVRWGHDGIADLNKLVTVNPAGLYLIVAYWVNSSGEIVGLGVAADGLHGYLATPNRGEDLSSDLPNAARPLVTGRDRDGVIRRLGIRLP